MRTYDECLEDISKPENYVPIYQDRVQAAVNRIYIHPRGAALNDMVAIAERAYVSVREVITAILPELDKPLPPRQQS